MCIRDSSLVGKFGELSHNIGSNITWLIIPVTILVGFVFAAIDKSGSETEDPFENKISDTPMTCLLYTSDAADERSSVDLGGRRIIKKKKNHKHRTASIQYYTTIAH